MSKGKKFVVICCVTMGIGMALCMVGIAMGGRVNGINVGANGVSVSTLHGEQNGKTPLYQTGEEELDKFDGIKIDVSYADVTIQPAEYYGISYNIDERYNFSYKIENGTLVVSQKCPPNMGVDFTWFSIGAASGMNAYTQQEFITVYVPTGSKFQNVDIDNDSGEVVCGNFYADKLNIKSEYSDVKLEKVGSKDAVITMDSGNFKAASFSDGDFTVENEYGNIVLEDVKAGQLKLTANSGNLEVAEVTADSLFVDDEYGNVSLQKIYTDGMNLNADSGSISLADVETNDVVIKAEYGDVDGRNVKTGSLSGTLSSGNCKMKELTVKNVDLKSEYGNVELELMSKLTDYSYNLETEYGEISIGKKKMGENYESLEDGKEKIAVYCESGNVEIEGESNE